MRKPVMIQKSDFTDYALNLGVWDALVEGMPADTEEVEVMRSAIQPDQVTNC